MSTDLPDLIKDDPFLGALAVLAAAREEASELAQQEWIEGRWVGDEEADERQEAEAHALAAATGRGGRFPATYVAEGVSLAIFRGARGVPTLRNQGTGAVDLLLDGAVRRLEPAHELRLPHLEGPPDDVQVRGPDGQVFSVPRR